MASVLSELVAVLAPPACAACRRPLPRADALVCGSCLAAIPWARGWRCPRCALAGHGGRRCPARDSAFDAAWSPVIYAGAAQALVGALKFRAALGVADLLGAQVAANLPPGFRGLPVVPVPAHGGRRRRRGYDPAGILAAAVARRADVPLLEVLHREDRARRQVGSRRAQRRRTPLRVRVALHPPSRLLLVDDVHTTGATLDACARALREAGAEWIAAVTYARAA
jgi:predicted amidophosphoribosyltransferase